MSQITKEQAREMLQLFIETLIDQGQELPLHDVIVFNGKINDGEFVQYKWRYLLKIAYEL